MVATPSLDLSATLPTNAIADHDVNAALVNGVAFHIADIIQIACSQQQCGAFDLLIALDVFLTDV